MRQTSFANAVRLWLQLVRDVTVVPSGMNHFRILHEEVRERAVRGDVWIVTRALEEVGDLENGGGKDGCGFVPWCNFVLSCSYDGRLGGQLLEVVFAFLTVRVAGGGDGCGRFVPKSMFWQLEKEAIGRSPMLCCGLLSICLVYCLMSGHNTGSTTNQVQRTSNLLSI